MRFSTAAVLALPLLAAANESPFQQYKAKFQNFLSNLGVAGPVAEKSEAPATPSVASTGKGKKKVMEAKPIHTLTLDNWKDTLYAPVKAEATQPEEWMVLISGRNKTCFGHCLKIEAAFNESATKFAELPQSPHLGFINCDDEPVLCNVWSAGAGNLWVFQMLPPPAPVDIYYKRLNFTTTTSQDIVDSYTGKAEDAKFLKNEGYFHPFDGPLARYGLAVPLAYFFWALNQIPSWAMMLVVSFVSRSMINRRMDGMNRPGNAPGGAAPRAAPPGDGRS